MSKWFFFVFFSCVHLWGKQLKTDVAAPAAILINGETGAILYEKNIHEKIYPASITKIATALYILERNGVRLHENVTITPHPLVTVPSHVKHAENSLHPPHRLEIGGSHAGLRAGESLSVQTLLYGLLLSSGNDAANVLAEWNSGTIEKFMDELNMYLKGKGILETHFANPHGLHHAQHWTSAYDMALITKLALKNPTFCEIVKTSQFLRPKTQKQQAHYFVQGNKLVKPGPFFYSKAIGVKTGHTSHAGYTLVGAATHEGRTLIAVLLGCLTSDQRFKDAIKLFESAFSEKRVIRTLFAKGSEIFTREIQGAKSLLKASLKDDLVMKYYPAEEPQFRAEIVWDPCKFPIQRDHRVGCLRVVDLDGKILEQLPIYATETVEARFHFRILILAMGLLGGIGFALYYFLKKRHKLIER